MARLSPLNDQRIQATKNAWFNDSHTLITAMDFIPAADEWFKSTKINTLDGWSTFDCIDAVLGCTHFIESLILRYGWDGIQILPEEYAYYGLMGKYGNEVGALEPNKPMIVSLPNWRYADLRPNWDNILKECEQKNIDVHIDFAWITVARDIEMDLSHPAIKSFAMSLSKYNMEWNRVGLRWSRQRTMDSVTIFNKFHSEANSSLMTCGKHIIESIPRDYGWNTYKDLHYQTCEELNLLPSKLIHVAHAQDLSGVVGIGDNLSLKDPNRI